MSKAKDRARAESGTIFRDGKLVNKEEWYAAHPTYEMRLAQQAKVDKAVTAEMQEKRLAEKGIVIVKDDNKFSYFCGKCQHRHAEGSKICTEHRQYARTPVTLRKEA